MTEFEKVNSLCPKCQLFVTQMQHLCQPHLNPQLAMLKGEEKLVHVPLSQEMFLRTVSSAHRLRVATTAETF